MQDAIDTMLDGLSELIYVSDPETKELLYLNRAGREVYGADAVDGVHTCYEVLLGKDAPCDFCKPSNLSRDSLYEREFTDPTNGRHFLLRDKLVEWDGRLARLAIAFDISDSQAEKRALGYLVRANSVVISCIEVLENEQDINKALDEVLRKVGLFFEADRVRVFKIEGQTISNTHEWCAEGMAFQKDFLQDIPLSILGSWAQTFAEGKAVAVKDVSALETKGHSSGRLLLKDKGVRSLVAVPLEDEGNVIGIIDVDNPHHSDHLDVVKSPLLGLAHFVSSSIRRNAARRKIEELTWSDKLTGALSRAAFYRDFDGATQDCLGLVLVDADRLAVVNRELGREKGDEILCLIADQMKAVFGNRVYRIGDDEFCAVLKEMDYAAFTNLLNDAAQRLAAAGARASMGPVWRAHSEDMLGLLDTAHSRMARAKAGRHRAEDMGINLTSNSAIRGLLCPGGAKEAVDSGKFDIYLMPQVSGSTGELIGAEALIRYLDAEKNIQALPASFVPALEDMGEITHVDFFALRRACETLVRWQQEGRAVVPLSVNFSRLTVEVEGFVGYVMQVIGGYGIDPALLELEVTESAMGQSREVQIRVANELREKGFRIAVDDFGVDNANFSLFTQFDFDVLKLDKSLIWGLVLEDRTLHAIRGLIGLCADLGIKSVAEGVETEAQSKTLQEAGCTRLQGYLVGRPVSIDEFERLYLG